MDTPLNRVENLLQNGDALYIHQIVKQAGITEKAAKASIKTLSSMGQIEVIPTPGRWGNRYAWLAAMPMAARNGNRTGMPETPTQGMPAKTAEAAEAAAPGAAEQVAPPEAAAPGQKRTTASAARYVIIAPKRRPRIVTGSDRAAKAAISAVRRGAPGAEVFALVPVGRARRGAEWVVTPA